MLTVCAIIFYIKFPDKKSLVLGKAHTQKKEKRDKRIPETVNCF